MSFCIRCNKSFNTEVNFCTNCGSKIEKEKNNNRNIVDAILGFYIMIVCYIAFSHFIYKAYQNSLFTEILLEVIFIGIILTFCFFNFKEILHLYKLPSIKINLYLKYLLITVFSCLLIYFSVGKLNELIFPDKDLNIFSSYLYLENPLLWSLFFVAILPPIFEELAFRGYLFNLLLKLTSPKSTIVATAFLFALIHFSFISIIWIFPFGLFLGYLRKKHDTLWIPMLVHFTHNFLVVMLDFYFHNKELTELL